MTTESLITRLRTPPVWVRHESYSRPEPAGYERDSAPFEAADVIAMQARQIQAMEELVAATKEVLRISDRKHDAWDRAKAALAKVEGGAT